MNEDMNKIVIDDAEYKTLLTKKYLNKKKYIVDNPKLIKAFIPGVIRDIFVKEGDSVIEGDSLLTLEAMKMKNLLKSNINGRILKINVNQDQVVKKNELLIEFE